MFKKVIALLTLGISLGVAAQTGNGQASGADQQASKKNKDVITVRGCLAKQNSDFILLQADQGNSYQLARSHKVSFGSYLGQQVEVTGRQYPSMATSSDYLSRSGVASPVTIRVRTIKTIAPRCNGD
jgi:hypothetical protein